jgi:hypothetical protein
MDGDSGGAGLAEGEGGVTFIELLLDVLFAAAHSKKTPPRCDSRLRELGLMWRETGLHRLVHVKCRLCLPSHSHRSSHRS